MFFISYQMFNTWRYIFVNVRASTRWAICANSWATPLTCLLLNSIWKFWKLLTNNCLQACIVQPNWLLSSTFDLKWSTTILESRAKSTVSFLSYFCILIRLVKKFWNYLSFPFNILDTFPSESKPNLNTL